MNIIHYLGGKFRLKKKISDIINKNIGDLDFYSPCCGSCWIETEIKAKKRFLSDYHFYLIEMWKAFQKEDYIPKMPVTEEVYAHVKANLDEDPAYSGFVGFGNSFGGKWFGGYARGRDIAYEETAYRSIKKKVVKLLDAEFSHKSLFNVKPVNSLIYIDPPYEGTTSYRGVEKFNHELFWEYAREVSKNNLVLISEFKAPDDFVVIQEFTKNTDLRNSEQKQIKVMDRLFVHESQVDKWKI